MPKPRRRNQNHMPPIDRLIRLIAEIEVARYVKEVKSKQRNSEEEGQ